MMSWQITDDKETELVESHNRICPENPENIKNLFTKYICSVLFQINALSAMPQSILLSSFRSAEIQNAIVFSTRMLFWYSSIICRLKRRAKKHL